MDHFPYYNNQARAWRNSIRHNLSLNECFIKAGRAENGKGNYWALHPACIDDFSKGDYRRRHARRRARGAAFSDLNMPPALYYRPGYPQMTSSPLSGRQFSTQHVMPPTHHVLSPAQHLLSPVQHVLSPGQHMLSPYMSPILPAFPFQYLPPSATITVPGGSVAPHSEANPHLPINLQQCRNTAAASAESSIKRRQTLHMTSPDNHPAIPQDVTPGGPSRRLYRPSGNARYSPYALPHVWWNHCV